MPPRRGATGLAGILLVDKPVGPTSHDVVATVRRALGERRVGHAGTLDPMASGLLVVLVGPYTRLEPYISGADKAYEARIVFGSATDTDDAEGEVIETAPVPEEAFDVARASSVLEGLLGPSLQRPPAYSAIKRDGRIAHRAARAGQPLDLPERHVHVYRAELRSADAVSRSWDVDFLVSKGTYVRALARDIGRAVGSAAHLGALRRTSSGSLDVADAVAFPPAADAQSARSLAESFIDPFAALGLPIVDSDVALVADGRRVPAPGPDGETVAVRVGSRLAGIYHRVDGVLIPDVVLPLGKV